MIAMGGGVIGGASAVVGGLLEARRQLNLALQDRAEDRIDREVELKRDAYRGYLRWVSALPSEREVIDLEPTAKIESVRQGQEIMADLLLVASRELKRA